MSRARQFRELLQQLFERKRARHARAERAQVVAGIGALSERNPVREGLQPTRDRPPEHECAHVRSKSCSLGLGSFQQAQSLFLLRC